MRIDKVYIEQFKNLNQFTIDLDETKMQTVLLGENAAGKSNFLEALVIIFRDLDLEEQTSFNYTIEYKCKGNLIKVNGGPDVKNKYGLFLGEKKGNEIVYSTIVSKAAVKKNKEQYLPKYVFSYYSGVSNRLLEHFDKHQQRFYKSLLAGIDSPPRPLFYARLIHSHFVLMAFYGFPNEKINKFLEDYLSIVGLESVLFILKKPNWPGDKKVGDPKFWYSKGVVKEFLNDLWDASIAPIYHKDKVREDFNKHPDQEHLYLYISNEEKLKKIAEKYGTNTEFFKSLESTYISDLIQEVRVKVKKKNVDGEITFKELSEGEQQLLTVLGLLRFTKEEESLILLDEPDTHLNPLWKWKYMNLLEDVVERPETSQIIMTTHDPLVIGGLTKEEIRIFYTEKGKDQEDKDIMLVKTMEPDFDPKGLGVAGILTSEFFKLPTTLDESTQKELNEYRTLEVKERKGQLTDKEKQDLIKYSVYFDSLGFNKYTRDPLYNLFIQKLSERDEFKYIPKSKEDRIKQDNLAKSILDELLKESEI